MNNQLQQLETSIAALVAQFKTLLGENQSLSSEVARLREDRLRQAETFREQQAEQSQKHEIQLFQLEQNLQQVIDELREESRHYQAALRQSADDIQTLLARMPAAGAEEQA